MRIEHSSITGRKREFSQRNFRIISVRFQSIIELSLGASQFLRTRECKSSHLAHSARLPGAASSPIPKGFELPWGSFVKILSTERVALNRYPNISRTTQRLQG